MPPKGDLRDDGGSEPVDIKINRKKPPKSKEGMDGGKGAPIVLQPEADRLIEDLKPIKLEDVGTKAWTRYHQTLERLNMQAQLSVMHNSDEYVVESFIDHEKIQLLIQDLIVTEAWKQNVLPGIIDEFSSSHYVKLYLIVYHESIVMGLLEKAFYHATAVSSGGDLLVELVDYCHRKAVLLMHDAEAATQAGLPGGGIEHEKTAEEEVNQTEAQRLAEQQKTISFTCACTAITLIRFMTDNVKVMPLGVLSRMLTDQDILQTLVPLLDNPPWKRTFKGKLQTFSDGRWSDQESNDSHRLTKMDAQVWLALNNLLLAPECRAKYVWDEYKKGGVMRLSKFFNEILIDQLPVLADLRRFVETLSLQTPPPPTESRSLVIQQLPELWTGLQKMNWKQETGKFKEMLRSSKPEDDLEEMKGLASMYDQIDLEQFMEDPKCVVCGKPAEKRCSRCRLDWYCGRKCQVKAWKKHQPLCDALCKVAKDGGAAEGSSGAVSVSEGGKVGDAEVGKAPKAKIQVLED